jgi:hypothetical protein
LQNYSLFNSPSNLSFFLLFKNLNFKSYYEYIKPFLHLFGIYLGWIVLHFIAANLYPVYCAELSFIGFLKSPFAVPTPHCQAMRFVISTGGTFINNMWIALGTYFCSKICTNVFKPDELK